MTTGKRPDGTIFASGANEGEVLDFPAISRGWGVTVDGKDPDGKTVTDPTNGIPPMEWFNALQKRTDEAIQWLLQHALPDWAAGTWPAGATVVNGGIVWRAQKETATKPAADAGDWLALFPLANLDLRYLHADKNLSDIKDAAKARKALDLDLVGNWPAVQANGGLHSSGNHRIYIDWGEDGKAHLTVDTSDEGVLFTTVNPPTAAQTGAYPKSGGRVDGEVWSEVGNNFRLVARNRGVFWRFDGNACYLMFTNDGDPHGGYNNLRPLIADFATGKLSTGHDFTAGGTVFGGSGRCWMATDGNIYGAAWGGYLSNWLNGQIGGVRGRADDAWNRAVDARNVAQDAWNKANDAQVNRISGVRLASSTWVGVGGNDWRAPSGAIVNGMGIYTDAKACYTYLQFCINGQWFNTVTV